MPFRSILHVLNRNIHCLVLLSFGYNLYNKVILSVCMFVRKCVLGSAKLPNGFEKSILRFIDLKVDIVSFQSSVEISIGSSIGSSVESSIGSSVTKHQHLILALTPNISLFVTLNPNI